MHDLTLCLDAIKFFGETRLEPVFQAILDRWSEIVDIVEALEIPYITTKSIQDPNFMLSDFYGCWLKMTIRLENKTTHGEDTSGVASALLESLSNRKAQLLEHPAMLCAVYLDPRFHYELSESQTNFARLSLKKMWCRIAEFHCKNTDNDAPQMDPLEQYLAAKSQTNLPANKNVNESSEPDFSLRADDFMDLVAKFENELPRLHHSIPILDYWLTKTDHSHHIKSLHELRFVALTILAIPSTQTPCERNFSDLNFVYGCRRTRLDADLLESILFIRTNRALFEAIKRNDMDAITRDTTPA